MSDSNLDIDVTEEEFRKCLEEDERFVYYPFPPTSEKEGDTETKPLLMYLARDKTNKTLKTVKGNKASLKLDTETIPQNLWPAATPFAKWILARPDLFKGKHILELGSGVGLAGLAAACTGAASVTLTDISTISVAMMKLGVAKSKEYAAKSPVFVEELAWGCQESYNKNIRSKVLPKLSCSTDMNSFDLVIGCDVFYFNSSLVNGLKTAKMALTDSPTEKSESQDKLPSKYFYCASVVRSERMDSDLEVIPEREGLGGGELFDESSRKGLPDELRMFRWSL